MLDRVRIMALRIMARRLPRRAELADCALALARLALVAAITTTGATTGATTGSTTWAATGAAPATIYELGLENRQAQQLDVRVTFANVNGDALEIHLPVWRTGLYRVLDPVGTLSGLRAEDGAGRPLPVEQTAKSSWRIDRSDVAPGPDAASVTVDYVVYANSLSDRTRHVDAEHAFVNPGAALVYADSHRDAPVEVRVGLPEDWRVASGMAQPRPGVLVAPHYDRLVDSPIEAGRFDLVEFDAAGIRIAFAIHGTWDGDAERLERDVRALIEAAAAVYGSVPVARYLFITHSGARLGGGTEYYNSTVVHTDPGRWWDPESWQGFLSLLAHEFFHTWNVKRSRPAGIARYDYLQENYTDLLWVAEGLTSYYDELLLVRAGLMTPGQYRERLARNIDAVVDRPGYGRQSLAAASFDAWTKGFHGGADRAPDKPNRTVSFYTQGGLLGLVLDLRIRAASDGARSLDDVMRGLFEDFPLGSDGFTHADVRALVARFGGAALADDLDAWVLRGEPLPLAPTLASVGWTLQRKAAEDGAASTSLELQLCDANRPLTVCTVALEGAGWRAGINAGDELLAIDGARIEGFVPGPATGIETLLRRHEVGESVAVALFRGGVLRTIPVTLAAARTAHEVIDPAAMAAAAAGSEAGLPGEAVPEEAVPGMAVPGMAVPGMAVPGDLTAESAPTEPAAALRAGWLGTATGAPLAAPTGDRGR